MNETAAIEQYNKFKKRLTRYFIGLVSICFLVMVVYTWQLKKNYDQTLSMMKEIRELKAKVMVCEIMHQNKKQIKKDVNENNLQNIKEEDIIHRASYLGSGDDDAAEEEMQF